MVDLRVGGRIGGFGKGDLVAVCVLGHLTCVDDAVRVRWLGKLAELILGLGHVWSAGCGSVAVGEDGGFLAHV